MAPSVQKPLPPMAVKSLDDVRPTPAKAAVDVNARQAGLTDVVKTALVAGCGSLKAAALGMGMDQGQLSRELSADGPRLGKLVALPPDERAVVFDRLHQEFGSPASDPKAIIRRAIRDARRQLDECADLLEKAV